MFAHIYVFLLPAPARVEFPHTVNIQRDPAFDDTDFNMTCTVSGSGDPKVQWRKDNVSVDKEDFAVTSIHVTDGQYIYGQTEAKTSTLMWRMTKRVKYFTCDNITHFDGHYTCAVSTQTAGKTTNDESKAFVVNVQCKFTLCYVFRQSPHITPYLKLTVQEVITCHVTVYSFTQLIKICRLIEEM